MNFQNSNKNSATLIFKWLANERAVVYKIYLLALLQGVLFIAIPLGIQGIIIYTMAGKFTASLILLSVITVLATLFIGILQLWQMRINETLQEKIFAQLTERINFFLDSTKKLKLKKVIAHFFEVVTLQKGVAKILLDLSFSVISIVFGLMILPAYSSWFLIFTIVLSITFYLIVTYYGKKAINANIKTSSQKYLLFHWFQELVNSENSQDSSKKTDDLLLNYIEERKVYYNTLEDQYKGILVFKVLFVSILLFLGTYLVQIGQLNIGQFVASEIIILLVINSVEKLVSSLGTCYDIITALTKIEYMFAEEPEGSFLNSEEESTLPSTKAIYSHIYSKRIKFIFNSILLTGVVILFLPWTQNVDMDGQVSVLNPESKPQNLTSRIAGRIEKWYINDGDLVRKNDTIAFISEIKEEYVDPKLVERSESQVKSKEVAMESYEGKLNAIEKQIDALNKSLRLKTEQVRNKLIQVRAKLSSDSIEAIAAKNNYRVTEEQFKRYEELLNKGVISKTDYENRKVKLQDALAKTISAENKIINTRNELLNTEIELNATQQEYNEKLMKSESDKFSTLSMFYEAEGSLTKLQNQVSNYSLRKSYYYVLAPQDGYINNIAVKGVGEIIKEGGSLCDIMPLQSEQAVELFVDPMNLPLIEKGLNVQLMFDGWPTFVFSGWPGVSYGTFRAEIVAFDKSISSNGKFRVLAVNKGEKWPAAIQIGGGVHGFALLKNVPVVYELWRKANGFPPEYYKENADKVIEKDEKK
jgi:multidrug resistance efflux pump